jgi:hypothetical protein
MVIFGNTDYYHAMDNPKLTTIKEFGTSRGAGDVLKGLQTEITAGASHVELGFTGMAKGSLGQGHTTPEMFDKVKREEIRQLSKINGVTLSTHASIGISGLSGVTEKGFSDKVKKDTLMELKRTVDFAADTAKGGAVVVHTSEFPRDISEIEGSKFKLEDEKQQVVYLADREKGNIYGFKKGDTVQLPRWKTDKNGNFIDVYGNVIPEEDFGKISKRAIEMDSKTGDPILQTVEFSNSKVDEKKGETDFKREIERWNRNHPNAQKDPAKEFLFLQEMQKIQSESPRMREFIEASKHMDKKADKLHKDIEVWKELEKKVPKEKMDELWEAFRREYMNELGREMLDIKEFEKEGKKPSEMLDSMIRKYRGDAVYYREGFIGFQKHQADIEKIYKDVDPIKKVGMTKTADNLSDAALYALRVEKEKKLDKPLTICPENIFPEGGFGSHPDELRQIVVESRKAMAEKLIKNQGMNSKEAKKVAEDHIKATFDIGHMNTWAKYFEENPKLSPEENKREFNKWMIGEVEKLAKEGIIGHVHISDNFGYYDEHVNPGQGNVPIEDFLKVLRNKKYEGKMIVEWGAQGDEEKSGAMLAAWANLASSPIYRVEGVAPRWSDIETGGYFGTQSSPFNIVGQYGASMGKDWKLWSYSEAPIE